MTTLNRICLLPACLALHDLIPPVPPLPSRLFKCCRELQLLRMTPALELGQMDVRRREFAARRIQDFTRKHSRRHLKPTKPLKPTPLGLSSPRHRPNIPPLIDNANEEAAVEDFVGTYKRSMLSPRSPPGRGRKEEGPTSPTASPSGKKRPLPVQRRPTAVRLADLHRQVVSNTRAKDRRDVLQVANLTHLSCQV